MKPDMLCSPDAQKIVKYYNRVAGVLIEYEMIYHRAWVKQIDVVKGGNQSQVFSNWSNWKCFYEI